MAPSNSRPRIAATINTVLRLLQGQYILDRFLDGYGWQGAYHHPQVDLVSLYVDQIGAGDLSAERNRSHPSVKFYPTIEEALTLGTDKLAVDGVASSPKTATNQQCMETPHLGINYQPDPESTFWRN